MTDSPAAKAIKEALQTVAIEQVKVYQAKPLKLQGISSNRTTWERLDRASRVWLREIAPDPYYYDPDGTSLVIGGLVKLTLGGKHRVTHFRNVCAFGMSDTEWVALEEDVHLPSGMVELVYGLPYTDKTMGHMVDITPLLDTEHR